MQADSGHLDALNELEVKEQVAKGNAELIFRVGEHVKVKDGDFKITSIGSKMMVLEGLPGTRIRK